MEDKLGVIVGRFQVNELHAGHRALINYVLGRHKRVVIFIGVSPIPVTRRNPLDYVCREQMIKSAYPQVITAPLLDKLIDEEWVAQLESAVRYLNPVSGAILYGGANSFLKTYKKAGGVIEFKEIEDAHITSGSIVRNDIASSFPIDSNEFRAGVIYGAYHQFPKVICTVDIAVYRDVGNDFDTLLAKKPGEKTCRFVGGYVDPKDPSIEAAAKREAREETGLELGDFEYVGTVPIPDWRYVGTKDQVITTVFSAKYMFGNAQARDDIAEVGWYIAESVDESLISPLHRPIYNLVWPFWKKKFPHMYKITNKVIYSYL